VPVQAPTTTDGGTADREPRVRACPACGAENTDVASFCWKCYRVFDAPAGPDVGRRPGVPGHWPPAPAMPGPYAPTEPPRSHVGRIGTIVVLAVAAAAVVAFVALRHPALEMPDGFAGLTRVSGSQTDAAVDVFRKGAEGQGMEADMSFYGSGSVPVAALIWLRAPEGSPVTVDESFGAFADGFATTYDGAVDTSRRSNRTVGGVSYVCAPITGSMPAGVCMWEEEDVFWVLLDVRPGTGVEEAQSLAVDAHDAVA
jgi:hypothetical protein